MKNIPTQGELFNQFLKTFTNAQICEYYLLIHDTRSYSVKFPGEDFFRYAQLCDKCVQDPKLKIN
ncbi:unnamed protein product [marine sediment metagenome]|uniref:Uncharacterized protein n=1 Tax=marine sediment metagenome TaxID=412755 RepID=X1KX63_9ZZZZ